MTESFCLRPLTSDSSPTRGEEDGKENIPIFLSLDWRNANLPVFLSLDGRN